MESSWAISNPKRWCCESAALNIPANGKLSSGHRPGKGQFSFQSQRRATPKNVQTTTQFALISHVSKEMLKILRVRLQQFVNLQMNLINFQMFKLDLEKAEGPEIKLPTSVGSSRKQESSRKTFTSASLTMLKPLTSWITTHWKILQEMGISYLPYLPPEKPVCRSRSNS